MLLRRGPSRRLRSFQHVHHLRRMRQVALGSVTPDIASHGSNFEEYHFLIAMSEEFAQSQEERGELRPALPFSPGLPNVDIDEILRAIRLQFADNFFPHPH